MPILEREQLITAPNARAWKNTPSAQFIEELASLSHETRGLPDPYYFDITQEGELFSPTKHTKIKDEVKDKTSHLGHLEYQAVVSIEQWAANNNEGSVVWISPSLVGVYPVSKIIVSEIEYKGGVKKLFNRAILLDFDEEDCMKLAWNLTSFSRNKPIFTDSDQIRATPLILNIKNWVSIFEKLIDDPALWIMVRNNEDRLIKKETLRQATVVQKHFFAAPTLSYSQEAIMAIGQMLGSKPGSCPPKESQGNTAFGVFSGSSLTVGISGGSFESDQYGSLEFECPNPLCKKINKRPRGQLIPNCQHCNVDVRC